MPVSKGVLVQGRSEAVRQWGSWRPSTNEVRTFVMFVSPTPRNLDPFIITMEGTHTRAATFSSEDLPVFQNDLLLQIRGALFIDVYSAGMPGERSYCLRVLKVFIPKTVRVSLPERVDPECGCLGIWCLAGCPPRDLLQIK